MSVTVREALPGEEPHYLFTGPDPAEVAGVTVVGVPVLVFDRPVVMEPGKGYVFTHPPGVTFPELRDLMRRADGRVPPPEPDHVVG